MYEEQAALRIASYVGANSDTILNALHNQASRMEQAATEAIVGYEAGRADPKVQAAQNATLMTNNGLRQAATMFKQDAVRARRVATELQDLLDDEDK